MTTEFTVHAKLRKQTVEQYVEERIREIKKQKKRFRKQYNIWATIMLILNAAAITLSILGISKISSETQQDSNHKIYLVLSSIAAAVVIILFALHFFNVIYRSITKERFYKEGMDKIQHEIMRWSQNTEYYKNKTKDDLLEKVEIIRNETLAIKTTNKSLLKLIFKALTGVEDA